MSLFQSASAVERHLKVLAYGPSGVGKTWFGLTFREAGPLAVIDTEGGTALYGGKFPFDVLRTKDFAQVLAAVEEMKRSRHYAALMIDPITVLWQTLQDAGQMLAEKRSSKSSTNGLADVVLTQRDWGIIKRQYARLMTELVNLPMHVVLTARQKDKTDKDGNNLGVAFDGEKSTPYIPDIILRFTGGKEYAAIVEKDRSGTYALGTKINGPTYGSFAAAISHGTAIALPSEDDAASATAATLEADMAPASRPAVAGAPESNSAPATDRQIATIRKLCATLGRSEPDVSNLNFVDAGNMINSLNIAQTNARQPL